MKTILLALFLWGCCCDAKSFRRKRDVPSFNSDKKKPIVEPPLIQVSGASPNSYYISVNNGQDEVAAYQSMLEILLRQLRTLDTEAAGNPASAESAQDYQREYLAQQAYDVVNKLLQMGALSAIADAESAVFPEGSEEKEEEEEGAMEVEKATIMSGPDDYDDFSEDQAREVLRLLVDDLMEKFFTDAQNTKVIVMGASSKKNNDEIDSDEDSDSSPSSESDEDDEYYYGDEDEDNELEIVTNDEEADDSVIVVNRKVTTNLIRIPSQTFLNALNKLSTTPELEHHHPQPTGSVLTPVQVEDARVYAKPAGSESNDLIDPPVLIPTLSGHSRPIVPTAAAAAPETTAESDLRQATFDLGNIMLCIAAALIILWVVVQLYSMYRTRGVRPTEPIPPPKVIPASIPNIYATPPPVLVKTEKPPIYVEHPAQEKQEA